MQIIIHRVNTVTELKKIPTKYGVEIDIRAYGNRLVLNHEPFKNGDSLEKYLKNFKHAFVIFNIKESGIENRVISLARSYKIVNYFLLDVEPYWIHHATQDGFRKIALRYSENEPINMALKYKNKVDWLWIDIPTKLPLTPNIVNKIRGLKTCLVCPERWNRPEDIKTYIKKIKKLEFKLDAVMTSLGQSVRWEELASYYRK